MYAPEIIYCLWLNLKYGLLEKERNLQSINYLIHIFNFPELWLIVLVMFLQSIVTCKAVFVKMFCSFYLIEVLLQLVNVSISAKYPESLAVKNMTGIFDNHT